MIVENTKPAAVVECGSAAVTPADDVVEVANESVAVGGGAPATVAHLDQVGQDAGEVALDRVAADDDAVAGDQPPPGLATLTGGQQVDRDGPVAGDLRRQRAVGIK